MSTKHTATLSRHNSQTHFLLRAKAALAKTALAKTLVAAFDRRQTRLRLQELDDHLLADIGISRGDIERIARTSHLPRRGFGKFGTRRESRQFPTVGRRRLI